MACCGCLTALVSIRLSAHSLQHLTKNGALSHACMLWSLIWSTALSFEFHPAHFRRHRVAHREPRVRGHPPLVLWFFVCDQPVWCHQSFRCSISMAVDMALIVSKDYGRRRQRCAIVVSQGFRYASRPSFQDVLLGDCPAALCQTANAIADLIATATFTQANFNMCKLLALNSTLIWKHIREKKQANISWRASMFAVFRHTVLRFGRTRLWRRYL